MSVSISLAMLSLIWVVKVRATVFTPECTLPPEGTNFVNTPTARGTMDILWSCLTIFILCTWTILHLNVPRIRPPAGKLKTLWFTIKDSHTKIKWMLITMVIPELILAKAINDRMVAEQWGWGEEKHKRPIRHYLANMGHFVLDWGNPSEQPLRDKDGEMSVMADDQASSLNGQSRKVESHIDSLIEEESSGSSTRINAERLRTRYWALNASQWELIGKWGIAELPDIPEHQLKLLDSGGSLIKIIAFVQILWMAVQLLVRLRNGHPSSQLEVAALAFAAQSFLTYLVNFSMPHDVASVRIIKPRIGFTNEAILKDLISDLAADGPAYVWTRARLPPRFDKDYGPSPIPNDGTHDIISPMSELSDQALYSAWTVAIGNLIFGGIHCASWNSKFPTPGERTAWRVCAVFTAIVPLVTVAIPISVFSFLLSSSALHSAVATTFGKLLDWWASRPFIYHEKKIIKSYGLCLLVLYALARLFLVVEMFRALLHSPPEVYRNTWTAEIAHV